MEYNAEKKLDWIRDICKLYSTGQGIYGICANTLKDIPDAEMIVSSANLGDTVFIGALAKAYKEIHGVKTLLIAAKPRQTEAVEWFEGVDGVFPLSEDEMYCLRHYFVINRNFYSNKIRYGHVKCDIDWNYPGAFYHIAPGFGGIPLMEVWKQRILDIPGATEIGKIIIPDNIDRYRNAEKFKNAVLIAPAAFTNIGILNTFWEKLVAEIRKMGYDIYCNSGGLDYDKIIEGTIPLETTTKELIINAPLFKHVVGVRSGFTDLVANTEAHMSVLHLGGEGREDLRIEYGTIGDDVRDFGNIDGIFPVRYNSQKEEEVIRLICEDIP